MAANTARRMWRLLEPVHAVTYFAPPAIEAMRRVGMRGFWMGYFAGRSAPMGPVGPAVVEATFYNFAPYLVRRAIPDAWGFASPAEVIEARWSAVAQVLGPMCHAALGPGDLEEVVSGLNAAVQSLNTDGRPLAAANAALPAPDDPVVALWQAATVLREHRGDGHVAALVDAEMDGLAAHVTLVGAGHISRAVLQGARGWSDAEWSAAEDRLRRRGVIDVDGRLTSAGASLRQGIEDATDRLAAAPWDTVGPEHTARIDQLVLPLTKAVAEAGVIPVANPMGLPPV